MVPVEVVYSATQCSGANAQPGTMYVTDAATLTRMLAPERRFILDGSAKPPAVDFTRNAALLVSMGTRPTSGYVLSLADKSARIVANRLEVVLDWQSPPPGAIVAQVLTSPCLVLRIPRDGYSEIRVLDSAGAIKARLNRP